MRCPRCNKKVWRKAWKRDKCCAKCAYTEYAINDGSAQYHDEPSIVCSFDTIKYVVFITKSAAKVYSKRSNQKRFTYRRGIPLYWMPDVSRLVIRIGKQISRRSTDADIEKYIALT